VGGRKKGGSGGMKYFWVVIISIPILIGYICWDIARTPPRSVAVRVVNDPVAEDRIKKLETKVEQLENWATKIGRRYK
jgi:hypothetical protein